MIEDINGHKLDKYQKEIVFDNRKSLLVVAGAGSGKTAVLSERVLEKLKKGINIWEKK